METDDSQQHELRRFVRRLTKDHYQVVETERWTRFGVILDLSVRGLRVMRKQPLRVGSVHDLTVDPTLHVDDISPIRLGGKVRWCDQESDGQWVCGLEIKAIARQDASQLDSLFNQVSNDAWTE